MSRRSFRWLTFVMIAGLTLGMVSLASARNVPLSQSHRAQAQATEEPTPINPDEPVKITLGPEGGTTPIDNENLSYRVFSFSGKANQLVQVTIQRTAGNFSFHAYISSQSDVQLAEADGDFLESATLVVKLPQDGNYRIRVNSGNPGAGDFEKGSVSVSAAEAKPMAAATAAATAAK